MKSVCTRQISRGGEGARSPAACRTAPATWKCAQENRRLNGLLDVCPARYAATFESEDPVALQFHGYMQCPTSLKHRLCACFARKTMTWLPSAWNSPSPRPPPPVFRTWCNLSERGMFGGNTGSTRACAPRQRRVRGSRSAG